MVRLRLLRPPMIIQSSFADRDDFWVPCQFGQLRANIRRRVKNIGRMSANAGENHGKFLGNLDRAAAALQVGSNRDDFGNPGGLCARHDLAQIVGEVGKAEMGVRVLKNHRMISAICWLERG